MNILLKHITRNMQENAGRSALIMLALFVVSILVAIVSICLVVGFMMSDTISMMIDYDYEIMSSTGDYIIKDIANEIRTKIDIVAIPEPEYGYLLDEEGMYVNAILNGIQIEDALKFEFINSEGEEEIVLNKDEVIITPQMAKEFKLKEGDEFEYYGRNGEKNILKVKYIKKSVISSALDVITNEENYLKIVNEEKISYGKLIGKCKENNILLDEDIEKYEIEYGLYFESSEDIPFGEIIGTFLYPAVIVGILVFAVIFVSLNSIVKIIINERIPVIGTFRSIGANKQQVIKMLIFEMLMYTIIPSLVGALIGVTIIGGFSTIINALLTNFGSTAKFDLLKYMIPISLITVLITVLFQMILSIFELIKVSKMSIKDSIFNKHTSIYKYSVAKVTMGVFFLAIGIITIIKYRQLTYWYCLVGILSIFVSIALIVPTLSKYLIKLLEKSKNPIIAMATNTLKNSSLQINTNIIFIVTVSVSLVVYSFFNYMSLNEKSKQNQVNSDIYVEEIGDKYTTIYDKTDEFYKLDNVKDVSTMFDMTLNGNNYDSIKLANHSVKEIHLVYSNDYEKLLKDSNLLEVDANVATNLGKYEIIISNYYKDIYNLKKGDVVILNWQKEEENFVIETPVNLEIVGFSDLSKLQNNTIVISADLGYELNQLLFKGFSNAKYFINLNDNSEEKSKEIRKTIINELGIYSDGLVGNVFTRDGYINKVKKNSEDYMNSITYIVIAIVGLALIGIINNQTVSFMERRRELATLYSIAMSRKQLKNMILIENLLAFINSTVVSMVFYLLISKIVEYTLQILLIPISIKFTISGIVVLLLVVTMILLMIQSSMRKHIKNMNIVEEIKYE